MSNQIFGRRASILTLAGYYRDFACMWIIWWGGVSSTEMGHGHDDGRQPSRNQPVDRLLGRVRFPECVIPAMAATGRSRAAQAIRGPMLLHFPTLGVSRTERTRPTKLKSTSRTRPHRPAHSFRRLKHVPYAFRRPSVVHQVGLGH